MILPDGDWIASFAGFSRPEADLDDEMADVDAENSWETVEMTEPPAELETMLKALDGRINTEGETRPVPFGSLLFEESSDDGCWRTAKTNVLLIASRAHWGCIMYRSWR